MKNLLLFICIVTTSFTLQPDELFFNQKPFTYQIAIGTISGSHTLYCNNTLVSDSDYTQEYKTILDFGEIDGDFIKINNLTMFSICQLDDDNNNFNLFDTIISDYKRNSHGLLITNDKVVFPPHQNIPLFIKGMDYTKQKTWTSEGYEVQQLFKNDPILRIPVKVNYQILNISDNKLTFIYEYTCNYIPKKKINTIIKSITGTSKTTASYDLKDRYIQNEKYERDYIIEYRKDGDSYKTEIKDNGYREYSAITPEDQNLILEYDKIIDVLKKNKNPSYSKVYNLAGHLALRLNKKEEAINYFQKSFDSKIRKLRKRQQN